MIVSAFAALVSMGGAPRVLGNCFSLQIIILIILTVILLIWNEKLLLRFGARSCPIYNEICYASNAWIFTPDLALIEFTKNSLRIYCGALGLMGIQIACQMTFISLGNVKSSIIVAVMRKFVLLIPLIYILPQFVSDKTIGVYLAEPRADFLSVTFTICLFTFQFKKALKSIGD